MKIPKDIVEQIKQAAELVDVVSDHVSLKKRGANHIACCPFHDEKTASFSVSATKQIYKCFGCGKGGDSITFLMDLEGMSYVEALRHLAKKYSITIPEREYTDEEMASINRRDSIFILNEFAADYFHNYLLNSKVEALEYLLNRGFSMETIIAFNIGYAENYSAVFRKKGFSDDVAIESGLLGENERGFFDRFGGRIIWPITTVAGRIAGFGGRDFVGRSQAKYINSPDGPTYNKSNIVYGLSIAKNAIRKLNEVFITEGYADVNMMHQFGYENTVSGSGTSFTDQYAKLLIRFTCNATLFFDGDKPGKDALLRALPILLSNGFNVKIASLQSNQDPDEFLRTHGKEAMAELPTPYWFNYLLEVWSTEPAIQQIDKLVGLIGVIPDPILRQLWLKECAEKFGVSMLELLNKMNKK